MRKVLVVLAVVVAGVLGAGVQAVATGKASEPHIVDVRGNRVDGFRIIYSDGTKMVTRSRETRQQFCDGRLWYQSSSPSVRERAACRAEARATARWLVEMRRALNRAG